MLSPLTWSLPAAPTLLALAIGYLLGSIPFGLVLTRLGRTRDIRTIGSGNIGATNVLRTGRKDLAALTLLGDALKGTAAVLIARHLFGADGGLAAGLAAFLGHVFPVWLGFRGGKGVATFLGVALALAWPAALAFAAAWLLVAFVTRYSSLSALVAAIATPLAALAMGETRAALLLMLLAAILWAKHHENIARLLAGTEGKIGAKG
ncbi:glycerol-3-phosphate 1-O-acyltransferase PlsY [Xanthobacter pseudotagetidis]|uniref:glycerol-3-phosphate 1-O-acyltransferase PlsY n=1 Tax=Xanthobacter pseudotagetidis TaxID=3119911 RepID=UPI0037275FCF